MRGYVVLALLAACSTERPKCLGIGCTSAATIDVLTAAEPTTLVDALLAVCINGDCAAGVLEMIKGPPAASIGQSTNLRGDLYASGTLWYNEDDIRLIDVELDVYTRDTMTDGDVWAVSLHQTDGTVLADMHWTATYSEIPPTDHDCHRVCLGARLTPLP